MLPFSGSSNEKSVLLLNVGFSMATAFPTAKIHLI